MLGFFMREGSRCCLRCNSSCVIRVLVIPLAGLLNQCLLALLQCTVWKVNGRSVTLSTTWARM
jgi:hypothetical protein